MAHIKKFNFVVTAAEWEKIRVKFIKLEIPFEPCHYSDNTKYVSVWLTPSQIETVNGILAEV